MVDANHKTVTEGDVLNKVVLKYASDKIGANARGKTADNDEWDWVLLTYLKKSPSPFYTYRTQKFWAPFWFEIIIISDIKRKINFVKQVLSPQNSYM